MRHTMGCKLGARAEIFVRRSSAVSITSARRAKLIPPPTGDDPYEDEAYRLWAIKQRSRR